MSMLLQSGYLTRWLVLIAFSFISQVTLAMPDLEEIFLALDVQPSQEVTETLRPLLKDYAGYKQYKAMALAMTEEDYSLGYSYKASSELGASHTAMMECEKYRRESNNGGQCEILFLGERFVSPGYVLKREIGPQTKAMAWRVEGPEGTLFLIGTLHILKPTLLPLPPIFDQMFAEADQLVLEVNPILAQDPVRVAELQQLLLTDPKAQKAAYDRQTKKALKRYAKSQGIPTDSAYGVWPVINAVQLPMIKMQSLGYTANTGVEMHYARQASVAGKAVRELEDPTAALKPLLDLPIEVQLLMLRETIEQIDEIPDYLHGLVQAWLTGDAEQLYLAIAKSIAVHPELDRLSAEMLDERNERWMGRLEGMLEGPETAVVMVGAGHMGGPKGLLALLRARGFEPVQQTWGETPQPVLAER